MSACIPGTRCGLKEYSFSYQTSAYASNIVELSPATSSHITYNRNNARCVRDGYNHNENNILEQSNNVMFFSKQ